MVTIKPFLDYEIDMNLELMEIINRLKADNDRDVSDAAEHSDYLMLHSKKRTKEEEKAMLQNDMLL